MNRLQTELQRLYQSEQPGLARAAVLELRAPADWGLLGPVWRSVQSELRLPAPAIAVSGAAGYQLWFSLREAQPVAQLHAFVDGLRRRYLPTLALHRMQLWPAAADHAQSSGDLAPRTPPQRLQEGQWSAFVAADLAPLFADEPWLDTAPNAEGQADLLQRLQSIKPADFQQALLALQVLGMSEGDAAGTSEGTNDSESEGGANTSRAAEPHPLPQLASTDTAAMIASEARQFLLRVMRDESVAIDLRVEAAKALLPERWV